jgi:hypothetical protein
MPQEPRHLILVEILRLMPEYRDINHLVAWESAFQGVLEDQDDESEIGQILWEVFDFGRFNMYGAFDAPRTSQQFEWLSNWLSARGVPMPPPQGLADW